jgi:hypothetical protein
MTAITEPGIYADLPEDVPPIAVPIEGGSVFIDAADLALVDGYRWRILHGHNGKRYAYDAHRSVYMHRLIAGTPAGFETDHRNGEGLDNRRANLRVATPGQNRANAGKPKRPDGARHTSRFKGVSWDRARGRWQAKITVDGQCRNLGRYDDEAAAARAYNDAALLAWGEFARLNEVGS